MEDHMEIRTVQEQAMVAVRTTTPVEKLSEVMGACYGDVIQYLGSQNAQPAGPPFAIYYNMDMSNLDVAIGFPVATALEGSGRAQAGTIPGGKAAVEMHIGAYDKIGEAYERLSAFVKENNLEIDTCTYEFYLNDPGETPPENLETEIYFPLK
jgi:effector-binding domain-containing protein